jgi:membrane protein YdbS with pleckstrin-like domain
MQEKTDGVVGRGLVLKTSKRSYVVNYILIVLLVVLLTILFPIFDIQFSLSPRTVMEIIGTAVVLGFLLFIGFLFEEPLLERMMRAYMITNEEFVMVEGILRKRRIAIPMNGISDITVYKGVFGRMLNYGDVTIRGFKSEIVMKGLSDPDVMYRIAKNKVSIRIPQCKKAKRPQKEE